jgi:8-amino-7-oxononanoate synthase
MTPVIVTPAAGWDLWTAQRLHELGEARVLRSLRALGPVHGDACSVVVDANTRASWAANTPSLGAHSGPADETLLLFAANDYLGLSAHPDVRAAAAAAAAQFGCGPRASALVSGYTHAHRALEDELAQLKEMEEALVLPTGYAANMVVLGALADSSDCAIFSDELNHASIVDGARLAARGAGAELHVYKHGDLAELDALLAASGAARKLIISDSLFSMDGDLADVAGLARLRARHGALLCLDEAHATLVFGDRGGGVAEAQGMAHAVDIHVGTLSKAFGSHGGFVASSRQLKQLFVSRGRPCIFSTALPAPCVAAASAALRVATPAVREALWRNVRQFGADVGLRPQSPIVPFIVGEEAAALRLSARLIDAGFYVPAIRPPTVPRGTSRVRVTLSAAHRLEDVRALAALLRGDGACDARSLRPGPKL